MATINNLPLLTNVVPTRVCIPVTCQGAPGATYRLPLSTVIALGKGNVGYTGSNGGIGPIGPQGFLGFTGSTGAQGTPGLNGATGPSGLQGIRGYTGSAAGGLTINLSTVTNPIIPYTSDVVDLGAFDKSWRTLFVNQIYVNTGNIRDLQSGLPIQFVTSGTTGNGNGFTGSVGARGFTGSNGVPGPQGPIGFSGFTGSAGIPGMMGYAGSGAPSLLAGIGISFSTTGTAIIISATGANTTGTQRFAGYTGSQGLTGSTGTVGLTGFTGSAGIPGMMGYAGSAGPPGSSGTGTNTIGYTGSRGLTGSTGTVGLTGYTGSAGTGGIQIYEEDRSIGVYTALNFIGLSVTASTQTSNIAAITISGTGGGTGYTGSAGVGSTGYTGSAGLTGPIGYYGSAGPTGPIGAGGITYSVINSGASSYTIAGSANNPALTLIKGFTYYFTVSASGHPFWIKTAAVTGTGNAYSTGVTNNGVESGTITFTVPFDAPSTLYYICQYHGGMVGTINVLSSMVGLTGYTGSAGTGGGAGYTGSAGVVNTLATGTYTISTLNVTNLVVGAVGAANIQSGNDLNLRAVGQITVNVPFVLTTATTSTLTSLNGITQRGAMVFVTDANGGAQPCYFDGVHWYTVNGRTQVV